MKIRLARKCRDLDGKSIVFWGISRSFGTIIWPDGMNCAHSSFLTSISIREYPFLVKGGTECELKGRDRRVVRKSKFLQIILAAILFSDAAVNQKPKNVDDLVLYNGRIYTLCDHAPWAEAIIIKSGWIAEIGSNELVNQKAAAGLRKIDLKRRLVLPGFIDSHAHCYPADVASPNVVWLSDASSIEEIQKRLALKAEELGKGAWIIGAALSAEKLALRYPSRDDLDRAAPENPVFVWAEGHANIANSPALAKAGITAETPDPMGGLIVREPGTRRPTGFLKERAARLVRRAMGRESGSQSYDIEYGFHFILHAAASRGITSIHNDYQPEIEPLVLAALEKGTLTVRWTFWPYYPFFDDSELTEVRQLERYIDLLNRRTAGSGEFVKGGFLKLGVDGTIALGTAVLMEPYSDEPESRGLMTPVDAASFERQVLALDRAGFQIGIHAVGDGGIRLAINAIERAIRENPPRDRRHRIEHALMISPEDVRRCAKLGIILSFQPSWVLSSPKTFEKKLGRERARRMLPLKTADREGAVILLNSDEGPGSPLSEVKLAVLGSLSGRRPAVWDVNERLSIREAIRAVTRNAAYADFEENRRGSLQKGFLGDLLVLSHNIVEGTPVDLAESRVVATIVGGRMVYSDPEFFRKIQEENK